MLGGSPSSRDRAAGRTSNKGDKIFELPLSGLAERAVLFGMLTRDGTYWKFSAMNLPLDEKDIRNAVKVVVQS